MSPTSGMSRIISIGTAVLALSLAAACGGEATCDSACTNILDKCTDEPDELDMNNCVEQCEQRRQAVPDSCASEGDAVVACIADADTIDCFDPQQSAACSDANAELASCVFGGAADD
jgi:hypothetical protein